jgi:hypothetical protein
VLNDIWSLVTSNLTGFNEGLSATGGLPMGSTGTLQYYRDQIDQFAFTCIYAIVVYMLGMSSFKLITLIPSKVMRWLADSVQAFNDNEDIAQGLMGKMTAAGGIVTGQISDTWSKSVETVQGGIAKDGAKTLEGGLAVDAQKLTGWRKPQKS